MLLLSSCEGDVALRLDQLLAIVSHGANRADAEASHLSVLHRLLVFLDQEGFSGDLRFEKLSLGRLTLGLQTNS